MLKAIFLILICSFAFVFALIEAIKTAVKGEAYARWAAVAAVFFPMTIFLICTLLAG